MEIIENARSYMKSRGATQWQNGYPNYQIVANDIIK